MVVHLEFIKAIVTAEEVFVLDPLDQAVLTFVDQLRQQLLLKSPSRIQESHHTDQHERHGISAETSPGQWLLDPETEEGLQCELPFEFRVLEIALEVSCTYLDSDVAALEREAYPAVDKLTKKVSTKNLEHVRILKRNLTSLLARVQKVVLKVLIVVYCCMRFIAFICTCGNNYSVNLGRSIRFFIVVCLV